MRFGRHSKLSLRYIGPFKILSRVGDAAYELALPSDLSKMHNVFHVSLLRKFVPDSNNVVKYEPLQVHEDLTYEEFFLRIIDRKEQVLRWRIIPYVKIHWSNHEEREATWELEDDTKSRYPHLFDNESTLSFEDKTFFKRVRI